MIIRNKVSKFTIRRQNDRRQKQGRREELGGNQTDEVEAVREFRIECGQCRISEVSIHIDFVFENLLMYLLSTNIFM